MYDLLIKNGTVIDGTGSAAIKSDIAVEEGKIVRIEVSLDGDGITEIDASGLVVCPGLIDIHSHTDATITINSRAESKIRQGVTTEIVGNCGMSAAPLSKEFMSEVCDHLTINSDFGMPDDVGSLWNTFGEYIKHLDELPLGINLITLVGFGTLSSAVLGAKSGRPSEDEMQALERALERCLDEGAAGLSVGLEYVPDMLMHEDDLTRLCRVLERKDKLFATHIRSESQKIFPALEEVIGAAEKSGCKLQISHLKLGGAFNWGKTEQLFKLLESAVERGVRLSWDQYPYVAWGTGLVDYIPPWVIFDGHAKMIKLLTDPVTRAQIRQEIEASIEKGDHAYNTAPWENVQIAMIRSEKYKHLMGKRISLIAQEMDVDPLEFVFDLLVHENGAVKTLVFCMDETDIKTIMRHPQTIISSDARALATYGELCKGSTHPRYYGAFPRILGKYVREENVLSLEDAIRKMTSMPAKIMGMDTRGILAQGMVADMLVFDPETVADMATFESPHQYPTGIEKVILSGEIIIDQGIHSEKLFGQVIK